MALVPPASARGFTTPASSPWRMLTYIGPEPEDWRTFRGGGMSTLEEINGAQRRPGQISPSAQDRPCTGAHPDCMAVQGEDSRRHATDRVPGARIWNPLRFSFSGRATSEGGTDITPAGRSVSLLKSLAPRKWRNQKLSLRVEPWTHGDSRVQPPSARMNGPKLNSGPLGHKLRR